MKWVTSSADSSNSSSCVVWETTNTVPVQYTHHVIQHRELHFTLLTSSSCLKNVYAFILSCLFTNFRKSWSLKCVNNRRVLHSNISITETLGKVTWPAIEQIKFTRAIIYHVTVWANGELFRRSSVHNGSSPLLQVPRLMMEMLFHFAHACTVDMVERAYIVWKYGAALQHTKSQSCPAEVVASCCVGAASACRDVPIDSDRCLVKASRDTNVENFSQLQLLGQLTVVGLAVNWSCSEGEMLFISQSQTCCKCNCWKHLQHILHWSDYLNGELWTDLRLALAHTVTEICTTSFVNFVILIVC